MDEPEVGAPRKTVNRARPPLTAVAALLVIAAITFAASWIYRGAAPGSGTSHSTATPHATIVLRCGTDTTPDCPTAPPDPNAAWLSIAADTPDAVLATFVQSQAIWQAIQQDQSGDGVMRWDFSRPDTPVFERELHAPGGKLFPDIWVLPFDLPNGQIGFYGFCDINAAHTAIRVDNVFGMGTPRPHGQLAVYTRAQAISRVTAISHVALKPGAQSYLIFAPIDAELIESGRAVWSQTAGGGPGSPLWLVPGADGKDRILGNDGKVYFPWQIPVVEAS